MADFARPSDGETVESIPAPQDALGWSPLVGYIYDQRTLTDQLALGHYVHMAGDDGRMHGVLPADRAPLTAVLRIDAELYELVSALYDIAETFAQRLSGPGGSS